MKIIFMGTPDFAIPSFLALLEEGYEIAAVVTQPDRPKGRKRVLTPPPVKVVADKRGIPVIQPAKLRDPAAVENIVSLQPDLIITAAYGQILPKAILDAPKYGCINVHGSLLPSYRGGAPIQRAIMNGERMTGVTIMYMAEGLDTGDILTKVEVAIEPEDTAGTVFDKLGIAGAKLLIQTLPDLLAGQLSAVPQNHELASYAPNITREDEQIDWSKTAEEICNQVRGLNPWPGAFTHWNGAVLKIWSCEVETIDAAKISAQTRNVVPGTVLHVAEAGIQVATGAGILRLSSVQPAGKKAMDVAQFVRGAKMQEGTVLGLGGSHE